MAREPALLEAAAVCYLVGAAPDSLLARWAGARGGDAGSLARATALALLARRAAAHRGRETRVSRVTSRAGQQG